MKLGSTTTAAVLNDEPPAEVQMCAANFSVCLARAFNDGSIEATKRLAPRKVSQQSASECNYTKNHNLFY
jgi:hypothetical protein